LLKRQRFHKKDIPFPQRFQQKLHRNKREWFNGQVKDACFVKGLGGWSLKFLNPKPSVDTPCLRQALTLIWYRAGFDTLTTNVFFS
jgi:hypothetical protein